MKGTNCCCRKRGFVCNMATYLCYFYLQNFINCLGLQDRCLLGKAESLLGTENLNYQCVLSNPTMTGTQECPGKDTLPSPGVRFLRFSCPSTGEGRIAFKTQGKTCNVLFPGPTVVTELPLSFTCPASRGFGLSAPCPASFTNIKSKSREKLRKVVVPCSWILLNKRRLGSLICWLKPGFSAVKIYRTASDVLLFFFSDKVKTNVENKTVLEKP